MGLSANFALYGDLSDRMMSLAAGLGPAQEIYSIDKSFIDLTGVPGDLVARSHKIRARILQWIGIPCGIGIGSTKTLAKLANHIAKTAERKPGSYPEHLAQVCNLAALSELELQAVLASTAVNEVWGVGRKMTRQLTQSGVNTVLDLVRLDTAMVRSRWGVVLERTVRELQGMPCIDLEHAPAPKQEIACTRSFGRPVSKLHPLAEAVTEFASRAAVKLRQQGSVAEQVMVFIRTSPFRHDPQYSRSMTVPLRRSSADTAVLVGAALTGLKAIYRPGFQLAKAGVMLLELQPDNVRQGELALQDETQRDRRRLMLALDEINTRYGRGTLAMASAGHRATPPAGPTYRWRGLEPGRTMTTELPALKRIHARRLREMYRSPGWPCQDVIEIELLAWGLLERIQAASGHECVHVTDAGIACLARAAQNNRQVFCAHEALVDQVAQTMLRDGRIVWKRLSLRAWLATGTEGAGRWKLCQPDVFSIRNSSVQAYQEPIVHEIKVSRADLLGDLKRQDKRQAYLEIGGQCWAAMHAAGR